MKGLKRLVPVLLVGLAFLIPGVAHADEVNKYAPFNNYDELKEAYMEAVEVGDLDKQEWLLEIGRSSLDAMIEEGESDLAAQPSLLADPDETYWKSQFPKLFSGGSWIVRNGETSLSLSPYMIVSHGTEADATRGWNAAFTVFWRDPQWKNTNCMREQFFCHYRNAKIKPQRNLEPGKTSINPYTCN